MRRRRYIAWMLFIVSMVMLIAAVLPHHHHQHILCLHNDVATCDCSCDDSHDASHASEAHHACGDGCVTNFQTVTPDRVSEDVSPDYSICLQLYTWADVLFVSQPLMQTSYSTYAFYVERLYATCVQHVMGLRAPPAFLG